MEPLNAVTFPPHGTNRDMQEQSKESNVNQRKTFIQLKNPICVHIYTYI